MKPEFKDIVASCSGIYRKKFVGGNWKSNMTVEKINSFVKDTLNPISFCPCRVDVVVAPVYAHLPLAKNLLTNGI